MEIIEAIKVTMEAIPTFLYKIARARTICRGSIHISWRCQVMKSQKNPSNLRIGFSD
jgi:hypothetical protein